MTSRQDTRYRHHQQQQLAALAAANNENALSLAPSQSSRAHQGLSQPVLAAKPTTTTTKASAVPHKPTTTSSSLIPTTTSAAAGPTTRAAAAAASGKQPPTATTSRSTRLTTVQQQQQQQLHDAATAGVKRTASRQPKVMTDLEQQLAHEHQAKVHAVAPTKATAAAKLGQDTAALDEVAAAGPAKARKTAGVKSARAAATRAAAAVDNLAKHQRTVDSATSVSPVPVPEPEPVLAASSDHDSQEDDADVESPRTKRLRLCYEVARETGEHPIVKRDARTGAYVTLDDPDEEDVHDPAMCAEYVQEIMDYLTTREKLFQPNPHYVACQGDMSWSMRSVLVDWLFEVHKKFEFLPETMFLAINIMDRFMSLRRCEIGKFQLVGLTSLFIAAKMEEIIAPQVGALVYMADNGFTDSDMLTAEQYILRTLDFDLWAPGPFSFIRRISKADDYDLQNRNLAKYLVEVALLDHRFLVYPMSQIAAGAFFLSRAINVTQVNKAGEVSFLQMDTDDAFQWPVQFVQASGYRDTELVPILALYADFFAPHMQVVSAEWSFFTAKLQGSKRYRDIAVRIEAVVDYLGLADACNKVVADHVVMDQEAMREAKLGQDEDDAHHPPAAAANAKPTTSKTAAASKTAAKGGRRGTRKQLPLAEME